VKTPADALTAPRIKIVARLAPLAGTRFQPTGFPDLGAAIYPSPQDASRRMLLVESAQSMANRLEATLWPVGASEPTAEAKGMAYVRITSSDGDYLTSSRTESHRVASAFVKDAAFAGTRGLDLITERLGLVKGRPIDHARVQGALFALDPLCLIHGVFLADDRWFGQPKIPRAVSAFIEADGVQEAYSGGVKFDHVSNSGDREAGLGSKEGYGNVPFPRTEYVAEQIDATFVIDTSQIAGYHGLDAGQRELLVSLALLEVRLLLDGGLRLRTACDFDVTTIDVERPAGAELPGRATLAGWVAERISVTEPLTGTWTGK
jgi:CRISPR-associated protein Csb1